MDLADLHIFRSVVNEGGVTRAAEKLSRVQSNVTTRVRQLEQDLGVELFIREGKRLHLSPTGKLLLGYADRILDLAQEARDAVHDERPRGPLRLGSIESTAAVRLPAPLSVYHQLFPDVNLELHTADIRDLPGAVLSGKLDAALMPEPVPESQFEKVVMYDEEMVIVAAADHKPIRTPHDIGSETLLAFETGCPYRLRLEHWFARAEVLPTRIIAMTSWQAILGCTAARMGISLLPRMVLRSVPEPQYLSVHPLPAPLNRAPTMLIWRKGAMSPKLAALMDVLKDHAGEDASAELREKKLEKPRGRRRR